MLGFILWTPNPNAMKANRADELKSGFTYEAQKVKRNKNKKSNGC